MTYDEEVEASFRDNPDLISMKLKDIAKFFFIQGELSNSNARMAQEYLYKQAVRFLSESDRETLKRQVGGMYGNPLEEKNIASFKADNA